MNVVHSGNTYQIYGDEVETYKELPVGTYKVDFNKFTGFTLVQHPDLLVPEQKIYGPTPQKVDKVLKSFQYTIHMKKSLEKLPKMTAKRRFPCH